MNLPVDENITADQPWLGVLMPVYNGARTLDATLSSMVGQSQGVQIVIVDQGSQDESRAIAASYADRLALTIIDAPDNKNWVQNTNLALDHTQAEFACLLHQDDVWAPDRTALVRNMIKAAPEAALWVHAADYIDENGRRIGRLSVPLGRKPVTCAPHETLRWLLVQNTIALPAATFRTADARALGGLQEALWYTADWDFWLALARRGPLHFSPQVGAGFRLHGASLTISGSRDPKDFAKQLARPLERHIEGVAEIEQPRVAALARVSSLLNLWLASRFHQNSAPLGPLVRALVGLGPAGIAQLLRRSQIVARLRPRLRLLPRRPRSR